MTISKVAIAARDFSLYALAGIASILLLGLFIAGSSQVFQVDPKIIVASLIGLPFVIKALQYSPLILTMLFYVSVLCFWATAIWLGVGILFAAF